METLVVEFTDALTAPDMARLRNDYGLRLDRFVPELAFVERVEPQVVARLRADFLVRAAVPLDAEQKLGPSIAGEGEPEFNAVLFDDADPNAVESTLASIGARDLRVLDDRAIGGRARVRFALDDATRMPQVAAASEIAWIDRVATIASTSVPDAATIQSGSPAATPIWDRGLHGEGQVIGLIDEGPVDIRHCFFTDATQGTVGSAHRKVLDHRGAKLPDGSPVAPNAHATFVAGIAAGDEDGNSGRHPDRGAAWNAKLVCGTTDGVLASGLLRELEAAKGAGAHIHNNSWNESKTPRGAYTDRAWEVDSFTWRNELHLVLGGTGNTQIQVGPPPGQMVPGNLSPPGIAKNAVCVSAAEAAPNAMTVGDGVFGPTSDGRRKPDLTAVGCGTRSALESSGCQTRPLPCGTSMAVPNASAAAALARQYFTEGWYPNGIKEPQRSITPTGALLKAVLLNSTVDMTGHPGYPSDPEGWGLIRLDRTLYFRGDRRGLVVWDVPQAAGIVRNETAGHSLKVGDASEQLKITLVFNDSPAFEGSFSQPVVNDLDLEVTAPDGTLYRGNDLDPTKGVSRRNGLRRDGVNTVEMVILDDPALGTWTIEVRARRVNTFSRQGYAVVATGGKLKSLLSSRP